jgi:hypothetical protein
MSEVVSTKPKQDDVLDRSPSTDERRLSTMASKALVEWFDSLERVLKEESELSGLLAHGSTIGQAREFVITRVLKTILPSSVHIGSGKIIDSCGAYSKQIDIILYDPRFPLMKVEGGGLYFVEGVLATIEVKSTIDSRELKASLENCKSVLDLMPRGEYPEQAESRINFYKQRGKCLTRWHNTDFDI